MATSLSGEGKLQIQTSSTLLKNWLFVKLPVTERLANPFPGFFNTIKILKK